MPDHVIHLRRAWSAHFADGTSRRLDLPTRLDLLRGASRLVRTFHGPPIDPSKESLLLRLGDVPGLAAVRLDDVEFDAPGEHDSEIELLLAIEDAPRSTHRLELVLDPAGLIAAGDSDRPWGRVGLLIRPRDDVGP